MSIEQLFDNAKYQKTKSLKEDQDSFESFGLDNGILDHIRTSHQPGEMVARIIDKIVLKLDPMLRWYNTLDPDFKNSQYNSKVNSKASLEFDPTNELQAMTRKEIELMKNHIHEQTQAEMKELMVEQIKEQASLVEVTQISRVSDNNGDKSGEEINDIKNMMSKMNNQNEKLLNRLNDQDKRIPRLEQEIVTARGDVATRTSKEEFAAVQQQLPNFLTKNDLDWYQNKLTDKVSHEDLTEVKINLESIKNHLGNQCTTSYSTENKQYLEREIAKVDDKKIDKTLVYEKIEILEKLISKKDEVIDKIRTDQEDEVDKIQKSIKRIEMNVESKAKADMFQELQELIRNLAHKDSVKSLETRVFPLIKEMINKIDYFHGQIKESNSAMLRFDELILDKASKLEVSKIARDVNSLLVADEFWNFKETQDKINEVLNQRSKSLIIEAEKHGTMLDFNSENIDRINLDIQKLQDKQMDVVTNQDLADIKEMMVIKADKVDLSQLYNMKANKQDVTTIVTNLDQFHKQLEQISTVGLSTVKMMKQLEDGNDNLKRMRTILLQQSQKVNQWITNQNSADIFINNNLVIPSDLDNFDDFTSRSNKEVKDVIVNDNKMRSSNIIQGNKGFSTYNKTTKWTTTSRDNLTSPNSKLNTTQNEILSPRIRVSGNETRINFNHTSQDEPKSPDRKIHKLPYLK